jgi:hypothetical protein
VPRTSPATSEQLIEATVGSLGRNFSWKAESLLDAKEGIEPLAFRRGRDAATGWQHLLRKSPPIPFSEQARQKGLQLGHLWLRQGDRDLEPFGFDHGRKSTEIEVLAWRSLHDRASPMISRSAARATANTLPSNPRYRAAEAADRRNSDREMKSLLALLGCQPTTLVGVLAALEGRAVAHHRS